MSGQMSRPRVLVIIPAWNEELTVGATIRELRQCHRDLDVLVVDDGSTDHTAEVARRENATVCLLPFNLGVGGAMRTGYRYALRHDYDVAVQFDADGQHDPQFLAPLVDALDGADVVIGARFAGIGNYRVGLLRRTAMRLLASTLSRLARTPLSDVTSGFRAANRSALTVFATHYPAEYLGDTVESLVIALRQGCRVTQVPVAMRSRAGGAESQTPLRAVLYLARAIVALCLALVRRWPVSPAEQRPEP